MCQALSIGQTGGQEDVTKADKDFSLEYFSSYYEQ